MADERSGQAAGGLLSPYLERQRILHAKQFIPPYADVLDIGCGRARILPWLPHVHSYVGLDLDEKVIAMVRKEYPMHRFFRSDIEREALPIGDSFSVIVMLAVLEHFQHATETLKRILPHLRNDGRMVLTTPHPSARRIHDIGSSLGIFSKEAAEEHNRFFDQDQLEGLARECGCVMVDYERFQFGLNQVAVFHKKH
jgi:SAM-dependent methyltransferase